MMTLPKPRVDYYSDENYQNIQNSVTKYAGEITETLGYFPVQGTYELLLYMQGFQYAVLLIGLVFNILIIMFVIISVLLIYSLLLITTETKTFEFGVMRLVGLSKTGFVTMIMLQAVFFVIPSLIFAYICSVPGLYFIYAKIA